MRRPKKNLVADRRKRLGATQTQCAAVLSIHQTTWSRWERNRRRGKVVTALMTNAIEEVTRATYGGVQIDIEDMMAA